MALSNTLVTNEVKDSAGAEVEFSLLTQGPGSVKEYAMIGESPNLPIRLTLKHQYSGQGINRRRRSLARFDVTSMSDVDSTLPVTGSAYTVSDFPVGAKTLTTDFADVLAYLMSFIASDGSGTTILYAGTGSGAKVLINGEL